MRQDPYKVIVWAPGYLGSAVIKEVLKRPEFELVGVLAPARARGLTQIGTNQLQSQRKTVELTSHGDARIFRSQPLRVPGPH